MTAGKNIKSEKPNIAGIFAAGALYCVVRCLFAYETNEHGFFERSASASDCVYYILYTAVVCAALSAFLVFSAKKENGAAKKFVPFALIAELGVGRIYEKAHFSVCGIVLASVLVFCVISEISGFRFVSVAAVAAAFFAEPSLIPAVMFVSVAPSVPELFSADEKKKNRAFLFLALNILVCIGSGGYALSHSEKAVYDAFKTPEIVFICIFGILSIIPLVFAFIRKSAVCEKVFATVIPLVFASSLLVTHLTGAMPPRMSVLCAAAMPFICLLSLDAKTCPVLYKGASSVTDNKILYVLALAFYARAVGYVFVDFENIIFRG